MSLVGDLIKSVAQEGEIIHEFTIKGLKFVMHPLSLDKVLIADGMIDMANLRKRHGVKDLVVLNDTIQKARTIALVALATKTVNGKPPVDEAATKEEQFKQLEEFRDELMGLGAGFVDKLILEYNKLVAKEKDFFADLENNTEK